MPVLGRNCNTGCLPVKPGHPFFDRQSLRAFKESDDLFTRIAGSFLFPASDAVSVCRKG
jgi:hypothetical protein